MIKKIKFCILFVLTVSSCAVFWVAIKPYTNAQQPEFVAEEIREPAKVILTYWENSALENIEKNGELITEVPSDFQILGDPCNEEAEEDINFKTIKNEQDILPGKVVTGTVKYSNNNEVRRFSRRIKEKNYKILQIVEQREKDNEALVRIGYGNEKSLWNQDNFLLRKEGDSWKIFAIMGGWELEKVNKYFAKDVDCKQ